MSQKESTSLPSSMENMFNDPSGFRAEIQRNFLDGESFTKSSLYDQKINNNPSSVSENNNSNHGNTSKRPTKDLDTNFLPWLPTRAQVEKLKVSELRNACAERDLIKSGKKAELQERILQWTSDQHAQRVEERRGRRSTQTRVRPRVSPSSKAKKLRNESQGSSSDTISKKLDSKNSIVDWRVLPLENNTNNIRPNMDREKMLKNKDLLSSLRRKTSTNNNEETTEDEDEDFIDFDNNKSTSEYLGLITRTYNTSPHTPYSNLELTQLYDRAKKADIDGDLATAKRLLNKLMEVTPHDGRIVKRLARLYSSSGDINAARTLLQRSCRSFPKNAHLWHGLAEIERNTNNLEVARKYYSKAIEVDQKFPNAYHALGRLEHQEGNIREAMSVLKRGIKQCPTNHRLYHALGGIYMEALMLKQAEEVLKKGMKHSPNWGQSFFYTSLAQVAYESDGISAARDWLRKGVERNTMHSQGWVALAQLEESEGNLEEARIIYREAVQNYEKIRYSKKNKKQVRLGDKWNIVYINWAKLEEKLGENTQAIEVYVKATRVFPRDWGIWSKLAVLISHNQNALSHDTVQSTFERACKACGSRNTAPYQKYAEYEISLSNYVRAREIYYTGAKAVSDAYFDQERGLASLFYDWGVLELKKLNNPVRAEKLFDRAMCMVSHDNNELRAKIYWRIGSIESKRGNYYAAQHFVSLSIHEHPSVGAWELWSSIATRLGNYKLAESCLEQANTLKKKTPADGTFFDGDNLSTIALVDGGSWKTMLCLSPWRKKLFNDDAKEKNYEQIFR